MNYFIKNISIIFVILGMNISYGLEKNIFGEKSAMIIYDISGGGQLTKETNLSIKGSARLRFKDWGNVKIEEKNALILTKGAIKYKKEVKTFSKYTKDSIITVDYTNKQLLERKKAKEHLKEERHLVKTGEDTIAGIKCDIWEGAGIKKCIYKNIVLKLESNFLDIHYKKEAKSVKFDINTSSKKCLTPNFPLKEFALFKDNIKTKTSYSKNNFFKVLENIYKYPLRTEQEKEREKFINYISKDIFEYEKKSLPQLLLAMKETRECLQRGENPFIDNLCILKFSAMKESLGGEKEKYIFLWDKKDKAKIIDRIEDEVMFLEARISCVNRAKNMTDLSSCMK